MVSAPLFLIGCVVGTSKVVLETALLVPGYDIEVYTKHKYADKTLCKNTMLKEDFLNFFSFQIPTQQGVP